jgi:hypothetical protein
VEAEEQDDPADEEPVTARLPDEPRAPDDDAELATMGDGPADPATLVDRAERERELHPPPPCEIEVVDAEGEPKAECVIVALQQDDEPVAWTCTNCAGIARLPSRNMIVDLVIDAHPMLRRERHVDLSFDRHRIAIQGGVDISGRATLDDRPARPGDGVEIELTTECPEPVKAARRALGEWRFSGDRITAPLDENGWFRVRGFDFGWTGSIRLVEASAPGRVICTVAVTAPSRDLVLRGHRLPPSADLPAEDR